MSGHGVGVSSVARGGVGAGCGFAFVSHSTFALKSHVSLFRSNSVPAGQSTTSPMALPRESHWTYPVHPRVGRGPDVPGGQKYSPVQLGADVGRFTSIWFSPETSVGGPPLPPVADATPTAIATTTTSKPRGIMIILTFLRFLSFSRFSARRARAESFALPPP